MGLGQITAANGGTWKLGDLVVNRLGFGAMRLPQTGGALVAHAVPRDRDQAISVLRRAVELGINHIDTAAFYFSPLRSANELINSALALRSGRAGIRRGSGPTGQGPISFAARSRKTCASSGVIISTW
jgi:pyridoxine 4-dehydrogenase